MAPPPGDWAGPPPQDWKISGQEDDYRVASKDTLKKSVALKLRPMSIILGLAALVMFLLLMIPSWNTVALLRDPVFMYLAGSQTLTEWLLVCCILLFLISYVTLYILFERLRADQKTEQTMLMISGIFLSTLGITLILFGGPLKRNSIAASTQIFDNCQSGKMTEPLYIAYEELESLRATPSCARLASIEDCIAFPHYPKMEEAMVLKAMETEYQCSGICQGTNSEGNQIYPPTLFSKADYHVSCDGMAARHLLNFNAAIAAQTVSEGCMLIATAIVISIGQLVAFCAGHRSKSEEAVSGKSYGAIQ